jgi:DNA-binding response OmpR family regulator
MMLRQSAAAVYNFENQALRHTFVAEGIVMNQAEILIIEDDAEVISVNKKHLEWQGYKVTAAATLAEARMSLSPQWPDLILLDVQMPDGSGYDFCGEIRRITNAPIIYLTCRDTNDDIIRGLGSGGDDYITKPFDLGVLSARVYAQLRRSMNFGSQSVLEAGIIEIPPMTINMRNGRVVFESREVPLTPKELQLLAFLSTHAGREYSQQDLLKAVWSDLPEIDTGTVRKHISLLRKKLNLGEDSPFKIRCTRKKGYIFSKVIDRPEW